MVQLNQIDTLDIRVLVNDQLDNIAPSRHDEVVALGRFSHVPLRKLNDTERQGRSNAKLELYLPNSCCGAHGLSLIIVSRIRDLLCKSLTTPDGSNSKPNTHDAL